ncbi:MAG: PAC2 family protein [Acidimicrobiia bacterium]|nr:PAC2 family protein [Acidimicrobiia bacterium]NNF64668.1 PAC2 family protein [Acidimicrobiia bacterium]
MDAIRRFARPSLRRARAVLAFEGWNDACDAASGAVRYLIEQADDIEPFAVIDPEEFFDFQQHRPTVEIENGGTRRLTWPTTRFYALPRPTEDRDLILVLGDEPNFRWKTFSRHVAQVLHDADVDTALLLGAFIGQVAHTVPVPIVGFATDPNLIDGVAKSQYEGPTGIVGVITEACREAGLAAISLWAGTPHYLAANPNPKAMLALLHAAGSVLAVDFEDAELSQLAAEFDQQVQAALEESGELAEYVTNLEQNDDPTDGLAADTDTAALVNEIEAFLKEQG